MTGTAKFTLTCGDWMTRLNHQCHHLLCGLESLCFSALNLRSLLNRKHDKAAREAKALPRPNEPTEQQRAQHNLTHLPYRSWCEHCVRAKGKERQSKRNTDRQPLTQIDYSFATAGADVQQRTILTATDVQAGLATSVVVPAKGRHAYGINELKKFGYETGRTSGIRQRAVTESTGMKELGGMSVRATPRDWKQAHGSIGRMQQIWTSEGSPTATARPLRHRDHFQ